MHIVVLIKEVPDTYGDRRISLETGLVDREGSERVADEIGERAVEVGLTLQAANEGSTVTVICMGPASAETAVRKALAMGADSAVLISDDGLVGADLTLTAEVLAAALLRESPDLVLTGNVSTDGGGGVLGAMLAEHLELPHLTNLSAIEIAGDVVSGTRMTENGTVRLAAELPAVASITDALPDPRFPAFKGIMAAKKKPLTRLDAEELGADTDGARAPRAIVISAAARPPRAAGITITDDGEGGRRLAEYLIAEKLV
ncbi:electron transfer flavoprotein beta subunit [Microbacterium sp. AG790]|uniref:electron transfer flavoprotein subunit beta/FixA family protein n=1 Tax=Microbacterium sp. AG790 TaxID=2183995 RepID=UPI000EB0F7AD|nr:electron transfer flavoprotein subunit beta/FixA family protein [Microbacterium sp. AG790]RKS90081.1 electron transfer flavoprotein beta subunit [Microbacterium sp. AG790]